VANWPQIFVTPACYNAGATRRLSRGRLLLTRDQIEHVEKLLAAGRSQRSIAAALDLDRRTVGKIALGRHPLQLRRAEPAAHGRPRLVPVRGVEAQAQQLRAFLDTDNRLTRRQVKRFLRAAARLLADDPLGLGLRGEHLERYNQVAADRRAVEARMGNAGRRVDVARAPPPAPG
jgi:hypothetical protein